MSSLKRSPPFRAEHVGSLLRPQELVQMRYDVASGKAQPEDLVPLEDKSVAEVVKFQQDCGLKVVSSGEYTRSIAQKLLVRV
jgi:methionine synthase II (cobalamin-independent)